MRFLPYNQEQDCLLPPSGHDFLDPRTSAFSCTRWLSGST
jgi:hypothetical protein